MSVGSAECLMTDVEGRGYTRTLGVLSTDIIAIAFDCSYLE